MTPLGAMQVPELGGDGRALWGTRLRRGTWKESSSQELAQLNHQPSYTTKLPVVPC